MERTKDSESLATNILTFLTGISYRNDEKFSLLKKAIRAVINSEKQRFLLVIGELRSENTTISDSIADKARHLKLIRNA